jgi:hypothetical protein
MLFWLKHSLVKRKCETTRCHDATASSSIAKVRGEVFAHFHAATIKVAVVCTIGCLAYQDKLFVNNPLDVKENYEHALDFALCEFHLFHWEDCCFVSGS